MSRKSRQNVRIELLKVIKRNKSLSYTQIQRKLSTNYDSIKENCKELMLYGMIEVNVLQEHPRNKHKSFIVNLTDSGQKAVSKIEKLTESHPSLFPK